jgi:hypothetical protein
MISVFSSASEKDTSIKAMARKTVKKRTLFIFEDLARKLCD